MKVHGDNKPEKISAGSMPNKPGRAWVRICLNAKQETDKDGHTAWVYDEYTTEVDDTPGLLDEVTANYDNLLREAKANEKSKADLVAENEELVAQNAMLKQQVAALTDQQSFYEDCIVEMAQIVYA
jgi:chromosome segregation ATPase